MIAPPSLSSAPLIVVTPVFEDTDAFCTLVRELASHVDRRTAVVAVDDGSVAEPLRPVVIRDLPLEVVVLRLKRNVGHQRAIAIGLGYVADHVPEVPAVAIMDSDGEDLPSTLPTLLEVLRRPGVDVVVAERKRRKETFGFRIFYLLYRSLFSVLTGRPISFGNHMVLSNRAVLRLASMGELGTHVAATVLLSKLRWARCPLDRGRRYAGHSKMNFVSLALHGFKGLMVFAEDVLVRVGSACAVIALASLLAAGAAILLKSIGYATPGWFSVALGILVLMFLQTGAITLMTLMMTGVVRSTGLVPLDYRPLIESTLVAGTGTADG